jgi:hypothetical protein
MTRTKKEKVQDCEDAEIFEKQVKEAYKTNVIGHSLKIISPKEILSDFWTDTLDLREGDLWLVYYTSTGERILKRIDVKHNGWIGARSIHNFGNDQNHYYLIWNDSIEESYIVSAYTIGGLYKSFEEEENCNWIKPLPKSKELGFNLNDFIRRCPGFRAKVTFEEELNKINNS